MIETLLIPSRPSRLVAAMHCAAAICLLCQSVYAQPLERGTIAGSNTREPGTSPQKKITISKLTTHLTGPIDEQGFVDYVTALNAMHSFGVTPENNAAILIWQAIGPSSIPVDRREWFYQTIGMAPMPDEGDYLQAFPSGSSFFPNDPMFKVLHRLDRLSSGPWKESDDAEIALQLKQNGRPLDLLVEASRRSRYFSPHWDDERRFGREWIKSINTTELSQTRQAIRPLTARAMLKLGRGEVEQCREDLLACHRLARLLCQDQSLLAILSAHQLTSLACRAEQSLAHSGMLSADQAGRFEQQLRELPPFPDPVAALDTSERWTMLDEIVHEIFLSQANPNPAGAAVSDERLRKARIFLDAIDWNAAMRLSNAACDQLIHAARTPDRAMRLESVLELVEEWKQIHEEGPLNDLPDDEQLQASATELFSRYIIAKTFPLAEGLVVGGLRAGVRLDETRLAFALAGFRQANGRFPDDLRELVPTLGRIPLDRCNDQPLVYRRTGAGYLLYSVGTNGVDEGGATFDSNPRGDDLVVIDRGDRRVSVPASPIQSLPAPSASSAATVQAPETSASANSASAEMPAVPATPPPSSYSTGDMLAMVVVMCLALGMITYLVKRR